MTLQPPNTRSARGPNPRDLVETEFVPAGSLAIDVQTPGYTLHAATPHDAQRLHLLMAATANTLAVIPKDGWNKHFKYRYTSLEGTCKAVKTALQQHGLLFTLSCTHVDIVGDNRIVTLLATFTVIESGAYLQLTWHGEGKDGQDKATAKAVSSGLKYGLLRTFLITSEADPDPDHDKTTRRTQKVTPIQTVPGNNGHTQTAAQAQAERDDAPPADSIRRSPTALPTPRPALAANIMPGWLLGNGYEDFVAEAVAACGVTKRHLLSLLGNPKRFSSYDAAMSAVVAAAT